MTHLAVTGGCCLAAGFRVTRVLIFRLKSYPMAANRKPELRPIRNGTARQLGGESTC